MLKSQSQSQSQSQTQSGLPNIAPRPPRSEQTVPILPKKSSSTRTGAGSGLTEPEVLAYHHSGMAPSKVVKGPISTEALKLGLRSVVKSNVPPFLPSPVSLGTISQLLTTPSTLSLVIAYERRRTKVESVFVFVFVFVFLLWAHNPNPISRCSFDSHAKEAREAQVVLARQLDQRQGQKKLQGDMESSEDEEAGAPKELLTEEEKKANHIISEKKRRNNIRVAFETMTDLVPALNGTHFSKATILNKANEYMFHLKERNTTLQLEVRRLTEIINTQQGTGAIPTPGRPAAAAPSAAKAPSAKSSSSTSRRASSASQDLPPISRAPKDLGFGPIYTFHHSDEMKIMVICTCYLLSCLSTSTLFGPAEMSADGTAAATGRAVLGYSGELYGWTPLDALWTAFRVLLALFAFYSALTFDRTVSPDTKSFQHAVESRISGEKASHEVREAYFTNSLHLLGCATSSIRGLWLNLIFQCLRQVLHLIGFARFERFMVRRRGAQGQFTELARSYYLLSHVYASANQVPLKGWVALLRALNVAESVGPDNNPLLAEIYSQMSFLLRFQLPYSAFFAWLAQYYRRQSHEVRARSVCSTKTHGYLALHDAWEKMANGELTDAASDLHIVKNYFVRSNRVRSAWEVLMFRGIALYLQGNITECAKVCVEAEELASSIQSDERSDADSATSAQSVQRWNKLYLALTLVHSLEALPTVLGLLGELEGTELPHDEMKWTENRHLQQILLKAVTAYAHSRQGKDAEALAAAEIACATLFSIPHKTVFLGIGQSASSLISLTAIECSRRLAGKEDTKLQARATALTQKMIGLIKSFTRSVPFATPRATLCEAVSLCLKGDISVGLQRLSKAEIQAVKHNLPMERALAISYKCVFLPGFATQDALLAESIFTSIGATHEAGKIKDVVPVSAE